MKLKSLNPFSFFLPFFFFFVFFCFFFFMETFLFKDRISNRTYDLEKDGVVVIPSILQPFEISKMRELCTSGKYKEMKTLLMDHPTLKTECLGKTGQGYQFQDYIWIIKKSVVHTCHRDNNGDFFNAGQKHPSYTMLVYLEPMEKCLGVIPTSHLKKHSFGFNISDPIVNLTCQPGDVIIFNANLIHVGAMNATVDHLRCQMKISHRDDISTLGYYQNFNKVLNQDNTLPGFLRHVQKRGSCALPILSNLIQNEGIRTVRGNENGTMKIGIFQKIYSYLFYGKKDFYDLPNAF